MVKIKRIKIRLYKARPVNGSEKKREVNKTLYNLGIGLRDAGK